jgi:hypothetical protein
MLLLAYWFYEKNPNAKLKSPLGFKSVAAKSDIRPPPPCPPPRRTAAAPAWVRATGQMQNAQMTHLGKPWTFNIDFERQYLKFGIELMSFRFQPVSA